MEGVPLPSLDEKDSTFKTIPKIGKSLAKELHQALYNEDGSRKKAHHQTDKKDTIKAQKYREARQKDEPKKTGKSAKDKRGRDGEPRGSAGIHVSPLFLKAAICGCEVHCCVQNKVESTCILGELKTIVDKESERVKKHLWECELDPRLKQKDWENFSSRIQVQ